MPVYKNYLKIPSDLGLEQWGKHMGSIKVRTLKGGKKSYEVRINKAGLPPLSKSFRSEEDAENWMARAEARLLDGKTVNPKGQKTLFRDVVETYVREKRLVPDEAVDERTHSSGKKSRVVKVSKITDKGKYNEYLLCRAVAEHLGDYAVQALHNKRLRGFIEVMLETPKPEPENKKKTSPLYKGGTTETYSPSTVRKHFLQIKKLLIWHSIRENYDLPLNLFELLDVPGAWTKPRDRRVEDGEWDKLMAAIGTGYKHHKVYPILLGLFVETAMRAQELLKTTWSNVNLQQREIKIPAANVKTRTYRGVPLSKRALALLDDLKSLRKNPKPTDRLFPEWADSLALSKSFRRLTHRAGIDDLRIHDLRHEAICRFYTNTTLSDVEIMAISGHTNKTTLARYANLRSTELADKLN